MFGFKLISAAEYKAFKVFAGNEADKVVVALKATDIGKMVATNIGTVSSSTMTGSAKFETVLRDTIPLIVSYAMRGGIPAAAKDVEDIARALVQSVYNSAKSVGVAKFAGAFLRLLGIGK